MPGQFSGLRAHAVGQRDRVRARRLEDRDRDRLIVVQQRAQRVLGRAELEAGDVRQARHAAILAGLQYDRAELLLGDEPSLRVDRDQEVGRLGRRRRAELAGRDLDVLFAHRAHDVAGSQAARRGLVRVDPDPHRVVAGAEHEGLADAGDARQLVFHPQRRVVAQVDRVVARVRRQQVHDHRQIRRHLFGDDPLQAHGLGQSRQGLVDAVLHLNLGEVGIGAGLEGHRDREDAVAAGDRLHVHHVLDAGDRLFEQRGDGIGEHRRIRAGIDCPHLHGGRHDVGIFGDREVLDRDDAGDEDHDRQHRREDRAIDEEF